MRVLDFTGSAVQFEPYRDVRHTIGKMIEAHHWCFGDPATVRKLRGLGEAVVAGVDPKDYLSEYAAWANWVEAHTRYRRDPFPVEFVKTPDELLREIERQGFAQDDCEALALFNEVGLSMLGGQTRFVTAGFTPVGSGPPPGWPAGAHWPPHTHAFVQALDPNANRWATYDPVAGPRTASMMRRATTSTVYPVPPVRL